MTGVRSSEQTTPAATVQVTRVVVNGVVRAGSDAPSSSAAMNQGAPCAEADNHEAGANIAITTAPATAASDATGAGNGDASEEHAPAAAADGSGSGSPVTVVATSGVDATMQATANADGAMPASAPEHADASVEQCGAPGGPVATADSAVNAGV